MRRSNNGSWSLFTKVLRYAGTVLLAAVVICFAVLSWRWPVVNDAALMHYVVFLAQHGGVPYRTIHDINLPGAYLPDWLVMKVSGAFDGQWLDGDLAWRVYDLGLLGAAAGAMFAIAGARDWFAGVLSGGLFALFHGRDGIGQAGQRDLALAVLFLLAVAALLNGLRRAEAGRASGLLFAGIGLALGAGATVKPFAALMYLLLIAWMAFTLRTRPKLALRSTGSALTGFLLPLGVTALTLLRWGAWGSFWTMCRVDLPYHAGTAHPPLLGMLRVGFPASFLKLGAVALAIMLLRGSWRTRQTQVLLLGFGFGLACFLVQHKGYGYQRYPYIGFLLLWVAVECTAALRSEAGILRGLGAAGVLFGVLFCAPSYLLAAYHAQWPEAYLHAIEQDLRSAGGSALNGRVQCVDSISGCVNVLYRMRLEQATGMLYDEFLFPPETIDGRTRTVRAVAQSQQAFLRELAGHPPQVFIVVSWLFPEGPGDYGKLASWPEFSHYLDAQYRLVDQQTFAHAENGPLGFRMYVRRPAVAR